jgi:hypothetical protein
MNQYILRYVAGVHWLVKVDQQERAYEAPFMLNEVGAFLWKLMKEGYEVQELSIKLQDRYEIDTKEALTDVMQFYNQLIGILAR